MQHFPPSLCVTLAMTVLSGVSQTPSRTTCSQVSSTTHAVEGFLMGDITQGNGTFPISQKYPNIVFGCIGVTRQSLKQKRCSPITINGIVNKTLEKWYVWMLQAWLANSCKCGFVVTQWFGHY